MMGCQCNFYRYMIQSLLFPALFFITTSGFAGPPLDFTSDRVVDGFEGKGKWTAQRQNNVTADLDLPQGMGHSGQSSLKVVAESGIIGKKGRNAVRFVKRFRKPQDWSGFEGIQFWLRVVEGGSDMMFCLHVQHGVRYRTRVMVNPVDEGHWKFYRFPFEGFGWDFESAKTTKRHVDPNAITAISIWRQMGENQRTVFYLDDVGLYKAKRPYRGPTISFSTNLRKALIRPSEEVKVLGVLNNMQTNQQYSLLARLTDFFGKTLELQSFNVKAGPDGSFRFEIPVAGIGYFHVSAELKSDEKTIYTEDYSVGIIPDLPEEQRRSTVPSIFGIWVGGLKFPIEHGARWYRTYCEPWRFEPDGRMGYRYIGKGNFPPEKMPYQVATPICYFRGMPKWLTSRPDRSDYQKFPPKDWDEYAKFMTWYVNKMKKHINYWEVWNEPVPYAYWMGSMEEMVQLHKVTYEAVKAADPTAVVMGPCPYSFLFDFLRKFFEMGGGKYIDAVVIHAYTRGAPEPGKLDVNFKKVRELTSKYTGPKDLFVTELGWDASRVGQEVQAQYLVRAHILAMEAGVKALIWHMYWDYKGVGSGGYSILNHNVTPRPALVAYCTLMRILTGMKFSRRLTRFQDPVRIYEFKRAGRNVGITANVPEVTVAWCWRGSKAVRLPVKKSTVEVVNIVGESRKVEPKDGVIELTLDANPIYVCQ